MSRQHATIIGRTKLAGTQSAERAFNIVILSEGFRQDELPRFRSAAGDVAGQMVSQVVPFNLMAGAINIFRVDIASRDSTAVDPPPGCGGAEPRTAFDARYCDFGQRRRVSVDDNLAFAMAVEQVRQAHAVLVIVNHSEWGGKGFPGVGVAAAGPQPTTDPRFARMAIHEISHVLGLVDEYADGGAPDIWTQLFGFLDVGFPNLTIQPGAMATYRSKWGSIITQPGRIPTTRNADCARPDPQPNPMHPDEIGAYEGGFFTHCRVFRPRFDCFMRDSDFGTFCPVCRQWIMSALRPHLPPIVNRNVALSARHSGKVLDVYGFSSDNGGPVVQWEWAGGQNQRWRFDDVGDGFVRIRSVHSGKVLDVRDASQENGAAIIQWDWWGGHNQQWRLEDTGRGWHRIRARHSGKTLAVSGVAQHDGASVVQWEENDAWNHRWAIV